MQAAGIESQYEYVKALQKDNFYSNLNLKSQISYWFNTLVNINYVVSASNTRVDNMTVKEETEEGENIKNRDFTGYDITAWVYDLYRPDEAYEDRGVHPSGHTR